MDLSLDAAFSKESIATQLAGIKSNNNVGSTIKKNAIKLIDQVAAMFILKVASTYLRIITV